MFQVVEEKQSFVKRKFEVIELWPELKIDMGKVIGMARERSGQSKVKS